MGLGAHGMYTTSPIPTPRQHSFHCGKCPCEEPQGGLESPGFIYPWRFRVRGFQEPVRFGRVRVTPSWFNGICCCFPDWKSEDRKSFPPKRSSMFLHLLSSWVFRLASTSHTLQSGIQKKNALFLFGKPPGATEKIVSGPFFLGSLSGLSCWSLLPTFWPWSTSMSLGSWNLLSGSGQVDSDLTSMAQRFRKGNPRLFQKAHLGWVKYDSIWPDLDVSGKSALAGEIWCVFLGKNGLNGTNKLYTWKVWYTA